MKQLLPAPVVAICIVVCILHIGMIANYADSTITLVFVAYAVHMSVKIAGFLARLEKSSVLSISRRTKGIHNGHSFMQ
jgi:hypothetical protein